MGPTYYLLLRRLHLAHAALRDAAPDATIVLDIATRYGFWDFGIFVGEYRSLFGESPSVTLHRQSWYFGNLDRGRRRQLRLSRASQGGESLARLARHPRWTFHLTPTSGSWLNPVETFFSALTRQRTRRGSFRSIVSLQAAIKRYLDKRNA